MPTAETVLERPDRAALGIALLAAPAGALLAADGVALLAADGVALLAPTGTTLPVAPEGALPAAWGAALLGADRPEEALPVLRKAVALGDATPVTLLNLALAEDRAGDRVRARQRMQRVADELPGWDEPKLRLAESLRAEGCVAEAERAYEAVLAINPRREEAMVSLAVLRLRGGDAPGAMTLLLRCCGLAPNNAEAWDALGLVLLQTGDAASAAEAFAEAHHLVPRWLDPALHLIEAVCAAGTTEAELARLEGAALADPLDPIVATARGLLLERMGRRDEAIDALEVAVTLAPTASRPTALLAGVLSRTSRLGEAEKWLRRACELDPTKAQLHNDHATILMRQYRNAEARDELAGLIETDGEQVGVLCNLAAATVSCGLQQEAVAIAERAIALAPEALSPWRTLANALSYRDGVTGADLLAALVACSDRAPRGAWSDRTPRGAWSDRTPSRARSDPAPREACSDLAPREASSDPRGASFDRPPRQGCSDPAPPGPGSDPSPRAPSFDNVPDPDRRLRLGLLSGSLRTHPVGWLTIAGFETLDPAAFDIIVLAQHAARDSIARRFRAIAGDWHNVDTISDADLAALGRSRGIDVLIDLGGYGDAGRMLACAHRLAPVQAKWVGMQNHSSGLAEMDWFITDRWETPAGFEKLYSERLLRLPDGYVCYSPPPYAPDVVPLPALANGYVTFGCFNNLAKITPQVIAAWASILRRLAGSRLILKTYQFSDAATAARVHAAFAVLGIEPARVELRGKSLHRAFLGEYNQVDIVLDPFPYSGGLTTCEALWMGVPTVTLPGEIFASRHSASHLSNAGLADWVVADLDGYIDLALARAADPQALAVLRAGLRSRVKASPLCDAPRFGRNLGAALRHTWREWCARH
jgi:tetratricopeptide (TPR) repeat protein